MDEFIYKTVAHNLLFRQVLVRLRCLDLSKRIRNVFLFNISIILPLNERNQHFHLQLEMSIKLLHMHCLEHLKNIIFKCYHNIYIYSVQL